MCQGECNRVVALGVGSAAAGGVNVSRSWETSKVHGVGTSYCCAVERITGWNLGAKLSLGLLPGCSFNVPLPRARLPVGQVFCRIDSWAGLQMEMKEMAGGRVMTCTWFLSNALFSCVLDVQQINETWIFLNLRWLHQQLLPELLKLGGGAELLWPEEKLL